MAADLGAAYVSVIPSMGGVAQTINSYIGGINTSSAGSSIGASAAKGFGSGFIGAGAVAGAVSSVVSKAMGVIQDSISGAVSRVDTLNNFPRVMANLGYSADDASTQVKRLSDHIIGLPTSLDSITGMVQQIAPLTGNLSSATDLTIALNDALLAGGSSADGASRAAEQYIQILGKGVPTMQDWRTLQEVMPAQLQQLSERLLGAGHNSNELQQAMKDGTVTVDDMNNAMVELDQKGFGSYASFESQARTATVGIQTSFTNMKIAVQRSLAGIIDAIGQTNISGFINEISREITLVGTGLASMTSAAIPFIEDLAGRFSVVGDAVDKVRTTISKNVGSIQKAFQPLTNNLLSTFAQQAQHAADTISTVMSFISDQISAVSPFVEQLGKAFSKMSAFVTPILVNLQAVIDDVFGTAFEVLVSTVTTVVGTISKYISARMPQITSALSQVGDATGKVKDAFQTLLDSGAAQKIGEIIGNAFTNVIIPAVTIASDVIGAVADFIGGTVVPKLQQAYDTMKPVFDAIYQAQQTFSNLVFTVSVNTDLTPLERIQQIAGAIPGMFSGIGAAIQAQLDPASSSLDQISEKIQGLGPLALVVAGIGAAFTFAPQITAVGTALGNTVSNVQIFMNAWQMFGTSLLPGITSFITSTGSLGAAVTMLTSPFSLLVVAAAAVAAGFAYLMATSAPFQGFMASLASTVTSIVGPALATLLPNIMTFASTMASILAPAAQMIVQVLGQVGGIIAQVAGIIASVVIPIVTALAPVVMAIIETIATVFTGLVTVIGSGISIILGVISNVLAVIQVVAGVVGGVVTAIGSFFTGMFETVSGVFTGMASGAQGMVDTIAGFFNGFISTAAGIWDSITSTIQGAWDGLVSTAANWGSDLVQNIADGISGAINFVKDAVNGVIGWITDNLHFSIPDEGPLRKLPEWPVDMMRQYAQGISKGLPYVQDALGGVMDATTGALDAGINVNASPSFSVGADSVRGSGGVTQYNNTRVVASNEDIYTAAEIMNRSALRAAMGAIA